MTYREAYFKYLKLEDDFSLLDSKWSALTLVVF